MTAETPRADATEAEEAETSSKAPEASEDGTEEDAGSEESAPPAILVEDEVEIPTMDRPRLVALESDLARAKAAVERIGAIAADGANSPIREYLGLESSGQWFRDRFLIADVVMEAGFPPERWFNFDPSYHPGQSSLLHRQPDNVWRLDFQLGWDADPEEEKKPENVMPRVRAMASVTA